MKLKKTVLLIIFLLFAIIGVGAITRLFTTASARSSFRKKTYFQIVFRAVFPDADVGPGETVAVNPVIISDSTENMFVFMAVEMDSIDGSPIYEYDVDDSWTLINDDEYLVYGYGTSNELTMIGPGDSTTPLTSRLTLKNISIPEYAFVSSIDVTFNVYAIASDDLSSDPGEAWTVAKEHIFNL